MSQILHEDYYPTVAFGFSPIKGEQRLHQMWISAEGKIDWRPVPMIEMKADRPRSVAGWVSEDDEDA